MSQTDRADNGVQADGARADGAQADLPETGQASQKAGRGNPYRQILSIDGALRFSAAGFLGRLPMSMVGLGTVLLITATTGRYGPAGIISGSGAIGYAICAPQAGKLADRHGQRRVLRPMAVSFAVSTVAFLLCARLSAPFWVLLVTGTLVGTSMPGLGPMVRARWTTVLGDAARLHTAFSLESTADEIIFVLGPVGVTLLATEVYPAAGLGVAMVIGVTGTLLLAGQRNSEPLPLARAGTAVTGAVRPAGGRGSAAEPRLTAGPRRAAAALSLRRFSPAAPGLITLVPVYLCIGSMFASIDLSTVDFAQQQGHKPLAGLLLGAGALGSAVGGLWYGVRTWRATLQRRFAITMSCTAAGVSTFWALPDLLWFGVVFFCCGMAIAPTLIAGYGLIQHQAPAGRQTEGMTWLSSAIAVGVACGSAAVGHVIDMSGPHWGYAFAAASGVAAVIICLAGYSKLRDPARLPRTRPAE